MDKAARVDDDLIFQRIDSGDIVYTNPSTKYKTVGQYVFGNKIGEGSYAKVKECIHLDTLQRAAVKIMKQRTLRKIPNGMENVKNEISLLRQLNHKNVIMLYDIEHSAEKGKIYVMMEYCVTGMQEMLDNTAESKFPNSQAHGYFIQLVDGLEYLHGQGIIHKDIKPGNLLLTCSGRLKITDFGVAEKLPLGTLHVSSSQGSPMFQPPEVAANLPGDYLGDRIDVWSTGCTLFNITSGKYPFNGVNIFQIFENISSDTLVIPEELGEQLADLLQQMLLKDPVKRMPLDEIKKHRWVTSLPPPEDTPHVPLWGGRREFPRACSVIPYLHCHFFPEEIQPYLTEHEISVNERRAARAEVYALEESSGRKKRHSKPTTCLTLRSCAQS